MISPYSNRRQRKLFYGGAVVLLLLLSFLYFRQSSDSADEQPIDFVKSNHPLIDSTDSDSTPSSSEKMAENDIQIALKDEPAFSEEDQKKWTLFKEILTSKNDNDSRADDELRNLSDAFKKQLMTAYADLPQIKRNERGFIVFLISRELNSQVDVQFIQKVFSESPCFGFENCDTPTPDDQHMSGTNEVTLNYPQLVALYQLDQKLQISPDASKNSEFRKFAQQILNQAADFPIAAVKNRANEIRKKYDL